MKCSESAELPPGGGKFLYYSVQLNSLQINLFQDKNDWTEQKIGMCSNFQVTHFAVFCLQKKSDNTGEDLGSIILPEPKKDILPTGLQILTFIWRTWSKSNQKSGFLSIMHSFTPLLLSFHHSVSMLLFHLTCFLFMPMPDFTLLLKLIYGKENMQWQPLVVNSTSSSSTSSPL